MHLGNIYADGFKGVAVNRAKAKICYKRAIDQNIFQVYNGLADELMEQAEQQPNPDTSAQIMDLLNRAYKAGSGDAAVSIAEIYLYACFGFERDLKQAQFYFAAAYRLNHNIYAKAMNTLILEHNFCGKTMTVAQRAKFFSIIFSQGINMVNSTAMFHYSLFEFFLGNHDIAFTTLAHSVGHNNTAAQYFTAALQFLASKELLNIEPEYLEQIMQTDRQYLLTEPAPYLELIGPLIEAIKIFRHYLDLGYEINAEYISKIMTRLFTAKLDLAEIETEIRQEFIPELKRKTLELAYSARAGNAEQECAKYTANLLAGSSSSSSRLRRKIQKTQQAGNVSMAEFNNIMSRFIRIKGGSLRSGAGSRRAAALGAGPERSLVHMHAPHGGARQPLEAGRAASAAAAMSVMAKQLDDAQQVSAEKLRKKL